VYFSACRRTIQSKGLKSLIGTKLKACTFFALVLLLFFCCLSWAAETDLMWSTFLGGSENDKGEGLALDGSGNAYVIGATRSTDFPVTAGALDSTYGLQTDAFVAKFNATGSGLDYATYLGGEAGERSYGIAVDDSGCAYVTGFTFSWNFPVTDEAFDPIHNSNPLWSDVFVVKLSPTGDDLIYGTFLGGSRGDGGYDIAIDDSGCAYVIGDAESNNFPTTPGAFDSTFHGQRDVVVAKFDPTGSILEYATLLGGSSFDYGEGIAVDGSGCAYVTGETQSADFPITFGVFDTTFNGGADAFVVKLDQTASALEYATFLGGISGDRGIGIATDDSGYAYVTGFTLSTGFPTTAGVFDRGHNGLRDVFVTKLNMMGSALEYATFLGGGADDRGARVVADDSGHVYIAGRTNSPEFPITAGAFDSTHNGDDDVFVAKLDPQGSALEYASFLGGSEYDWGHGLAVDDSGDLYVAGITRSADFPTTVAAFDTTHNGLDDIFVAKLSLSHITVVSETPTAALPQSCVLNQNYPNPFNPATKITYVIPKDAYVTLKVYNVIGAEVASLLDAHQKAGFYAVRWDARDMPSGIYFCALTADDFKAARKMVLLR
jgi:hypothetical protein